MSNIDIRENPQPAVHKGWFIALGVCIAIAVYAYWVRYEYAHLDEGQRFQFFMLEESIPKHIKDMVESYSVEKLTEYCEFEPIIHEGEEFELLNKASIQNKANACRALAYINDRKTLLDGGQVKLNF